MDPIISLRSITKRYNTGHLALSDVSLEIPTGLTGMLGPNGAGKSTMIKILLGLLKPSSGSGEVLGIPLDKDQVKIRSLVGYMPEDDCYIEGISGVEMVQFAAQLNGFTRIESLRRAHEVLDFCGMEQERYRPADTYSTGMRQKLKFAQAIVHDPKLLILDEPTSGLDPGERQLMLRRIKQLSERLDMSVFICTHILPDVQDTCDYVVVIAAGEVRASDTVETLQSPPSPSVEVSIVGNLEDFKNIVNSNGYVTVTNSDNSLTVVGNDLIDSNKMWHWAIEAGVSISSLTPTRQSLDQIFLQIISEEDHAN